MVLTVSICNFRNVNAQFGSFYSTNDIFLVDKSPRTDYVEPDEEDDEIFLSVSIKSTRLIELCFPTLHMLYPEHGFIP